MEITLEIALKTPYSSVMDFLKILLYDKTSMLIEVGNKEF
jgi:hypothetical protein